MAHELFWGEVRAFANATTPVYEDLVSLLGSVTDLTLRQDASLYLLQHFLGPQTGSFDAWTKLSRYFKRQYKARFEARCRQVDAQPQIESAICTTYPSVAQETVDRVQRDWGTTVPEQMLAFFRQTDGLTLEWSYFVEGSGTMVTVGTGDEARHVMANPEEAFVKSELLSMEWVFGGWDGLACEVPWSPAVFEGILWSQWQVEDNHPNLSRNQRARMFEYFEGYPDMVSLIIEDDGCTTMYAHEHSEMDRLSLDFEEYLEWHIALLGYPFWHRLFYETPSSISAQSIDLDVLKYTLPDVWPRLLPHLQSLYEQEVIWHIPE